MNKNMIIVTLSEIFLIVGVPLVLLQKSVAGIIFLGLFLISLPYYIVKRKEIMSDEMFRDILGKSSSFAFMITIISIAIMSLLLRFSLIPGNVILLIIFTIMVVSKVSYQAYWAHSIFKNENKNKRVSKKRKINSRRTSK